MASLKHIIALVSYGGGEGVFFPGGQGEKAIFPQLGGLPLFRATLNNVPSEEIQKTQEYREGITPKNFRFYSGTPMIVIGLLERSQEGQETGVGKDDFGNRLNYVLVAFTDYRRVDEGTKVPRHYFAILPTHFPNDPENKNTLSLANLLEANGYYFKPQTKEIIFDDGQQQVALGLNSIKGEKLAQDIEKACGVYFVDQLDGRLVENPVVPYPDRMPTYWMMREVRDEEGSVGLFLYGAEERETELRKIARVHYDKERREWVWERNGQLKTSPQESQPELEWFEDAVYRIYGDENLEGTQDIINAFTSIINSHPETILEYAIQYTHYTTIAGSLIGEYYASGGSPEERNQEILEVLAYVKEMARENPAFNEEDWVVEGIDYLIKNSPRHFFILFYFLPLL